MNSEFPCARRPCKNGSSHAWEDAGWPGSGQLRCHKCGCYRYRFSNVGESPDFEFGGGRRKTRRGTLRKRRSSRKRRMH